MRSEMLYSILSELNGSSPDIEASAILSSDGLVMAAILPQSIDEDRVGAMSAALLSLGDRTAEELNRGALEQVLIKADAGYILLTGAGEEAVITVLTKAKARLGLVFLDVNRAAESIAKIL